MNTNVMKMNCVKQPNMSMHVLVQNFRCSWKNVDRIPDIIQNVRIYMNVWQKRHTFCTRDVGHIGMHTSGILQVVYSFVQMTPVGHKVSFCLNCHTLKRKCIVHIAKG